MADHTWPSSLPCFLIDGFSRSGDDGVLRTQFPAGLKTRPRFTAAPNPQVTAVVVVNRAQLQTLMDFWAITLRRVLPFNYIDPTKPDTTTVEYAFLARPREEPHGSGRRWRVTLQLEQLTTYQGTFPLTDGDGLLLQTDSDEVLTT